MVLYYSELGLSDELCFMKIDEVVLEIGLRGGCRGWLQGGTSIYRSRSVI